MESSIYRKTYTGPHYALPTAGFTARKRASKSPPSNSPSSLRPQVYCSLPSRLESSDIAPIAPIAPEDRTDPADSIAPVDPEFITQLWQEVIVRVAETPSVVERGYTEMPSQTVSEQGPAARVTPSATPRLRPSAIPRPSATPLLTSPRGGNFKSQLPSAPRTLKARVTDSDFHISVLEPHNITFEYGFVSSFSEHISNSVELPECRFERLKLYKKDFPLAIWKGYDSREIDHITQRYYMMESDKRLESEFKAYALATVFLDEDALPKFKFQNSGVRFAPERMVQLVNAPTAETSPWVAPECKNPLRKEYTWDIRPDCSYYVSSQAIPAPLALVFENWAPVVHRRGFGPYLTIKFKKDEQTMDTAQNQIAIASTLALYNRWLLKHQKFELRRKHKLKDSIWTQADVDHLRHYSITFEGARWAVWCTTPKKYMEWEGCTVTQLVFGLCTDAVTVENLFGILNDIHYWGLKVHGPSFVADISDLIMLASWTGGSRVSMLGREPGRCIEERREREADAVQKRNKKSKK